MKISESRIYNLGRELLEHRGGSTHGWTQSLLNLMMENEPFRLASLRFVDVAPTLREDADFTDHAQAYFKHTNWLGSIVGTKLPAQSLTAKLVAPLVRRNIKSMARTFIAGETVSAGVATAASLHTKGLATSLDILGEAVLTHTEASAFTHSYTEAIQQLGQAAPNWTTNKPYPEQDKLGDVARANLSIKLSALDEHIIPAAHADTVARLTEKFSNLLRLAQEHQVYLHVDMENDALLPLTLDVFEQVLLAPEFKDYPHVGIVCQAYLTASDQIFARLISLAKTRGTPFSIRLVKGAYWDYEHAHADQQGWEVPVFSDKAATDQRFEELTKKLLKAYPAIRPCIGSHNARSLAYTITCAEALALEKGDFEIQMLYGMAESFRDYLVEQGFRVRVYCPVGDLIPGLAYLVRRLLENTANQSFLRQHGRKEADFATLLAAPVPTKPEPEAPNTTFINRPLLDFSKASARQQAEHALTDNRKRLPLDVAPQIGGRLTPGSETWQHACPFETSLTTTRVKGASEKIALQAIEQAHTALPKWTKLGASKRAEILNKAADLAQERWGELFALQIFEAGKDWIHADADLAEGQDFMRYYADQAIHLNSRFQPSSRWGEANTTVYEPRGVTAVIAPWNFPFAISAGMISAALATGNTVVYKPAEQTSGTGLKLCQLLWDAGVPHDVLHFLPGQGETVGPTLVTHPLVATVAFTGSKEVGLAIHQQAATPCDNQRYVKKTIIEMGGKNALIVDSDADLDEAVPAVIHSAFGFQGQKCSACSRVIVVGNAYEPFMERLTTMVQDLKVGPGTNPINHVGAVIDQEAYRKCLEYIETGAIDGTLSAQAPLPMGGEGHFVPPTIITDIPSDSKLATEEVFGPVLAVFHVPTLNAAIDLANNSPFTLTAGLMSRHPQHIEHAKTRLKVGNLYINRGITGALVGRQPFGGGGLSGTGTKAGGPDYLLHFTEPRVITENTMRRGFAPKD